MMVRETLVPPEERTPFLPERPRDALGFDIPPEPPEPRRRGRKKSGE